MEQVYAQESKTKYVAGKAINCGIYLVCRNSYNPFNITGAASYFHLCDHHNQYTLIHVMGGGTAKGGSVVNGGSDDIAHAHCYGY